MNASGRLITGLSDRSSAWLQRLPGMAAERAAQLAAPWYHRALAGILVLAAVCDFYQLNAVGYANMYYAAAIKSMLQSWHNFFFVAFDPGGFVTIDKPPLGFWIQAASARLFGFSGFSILLPEALAGVISVAILYHLVAHTFGPVAGLLAALALALMPVSVVTNRNNTIDSLLALTMLLAAWAVLKAAETGQRGWLLAGAALLGLGFNIKMLEAYLILPALALLYLLAAPGRIQTRLKQLALAGAVLVVISFSWITIVDLTPTSMRPYVGSSQTNSEYELAFGYNGLQRLTGFFRGRGAAGRSSGIGRTSDGAPDVPSVPRITQGTPPNGGGFLGETGGPSPLRLFNQQLGTQVSWLLPLALLGLLATGWGIRWQTLFARLRWQPMAPTAESEHATADAAQLREPLGRPQQAFILFGMWFLTEAVFFSVAGFFHTYYMVTMAPAVCALLGIGVVHLWHDFRRGDQGTNWHGWILPLGLVVTALVQAHLLANYPAQNGVLDPILLAFSLLAAGVLLVICIRRARARLTAPDGLSVEPLDGPYSSDRPRWERVPASAANWLRSRIDSDRLAPVLTTAALAVGVAALLLAPTTWIALSIARGGSAQAVAGPAPSSPFGAGLGRATGAASRNPVTIDQTMAQTQLVRYLEANRGSTRYLLATQSAMVAAPFILQTGQPVMALGGFSGSDPILTTAELQPRIAAHDVRYFLLQGGGPFGIGGLPPDLREVVSSGPFGGASSNATLTSWIMTSCRPVPASAWGGPSGPAGRRGATQLYDCRSLAAHAIR